MLGKWAKFTPQLPHNLPHSFPHSLLRGNEKYTKMHDLVRSFTKSCMNGWGEVLLMPKASKRRRQGRADDFLWRSARLPPSPPTRKVGVLALRLTTNKKRRTRWYAFLCGWGEVIRTPE